MGQIVQKLTLDKQTHRHHCGLKKPTSLPSRWNLCLIYWGGMRYACKNQPKKEFGKLSCGCKNNIRVDIREIYWKT
jgi:hypothetical protein